VWEERSREAPPIPICGSSSDMDARRCEVRFTLSSRHRQLDRLRLESAQKQRSNDTGLTATFLQCNDSRHTGIVFGIMVKAAISLMDPGLVANSMEKLRESIDSTRRISTPAR
jgi:hypothetical protein